MKKLLGKTLPLYRHIKAHPAASPAEFGRVHFWIVHSNLRSSISGLIDFVWPPGQLSMYLLIVNSEVSDGS